MKFWFDADNGPHVLILRPIAMELGRRGHEVLFSARKRTRTCELLDLYEIEYVQVGAEYGSGMAGKVRGTLKRAWDLSRAMKGQRFDLSFGHGSRALPVASRVMGIPTVTMFDYEWVQPQLFNLCCRCILLPDVIGAERCREAGIDTTKVVGYPGYKEELYLGSMEVDRSIEKQLGLREDAIRVLLRPPATTAHYHNPEAEIVLEAILRRLAKQANLQLVYLPRTLNQNDLPARAGIEEVIIPEKVFDGPSLVAAMDAVISGGGTMTREAALLGVPSYSFFRGRPGMVDEVLNRQGRLILLDSAAAVSDRLILAKRKTEVASPSSEPLVRFICDVLEGSGT